MSRENAGKVMTIFGPKNPEELGYTLPHEHLYFNTSGYKPEMTPEEEKVYLSPVTLENLNYVRKNPYRVLDNCMMFDKEMLRRAVQEFKDKGGGTITDVTPHGCSLDSPLADFLPEIKEVAEETGVNVVLGMGHYIHAFDIPDESKEAAGKEGKNYDILVSPTSKAIEGFSPERLAEEYIKDIKNGYGNTGIKPGVIGELGTGFVVTELEQRTLRAGAIAQQETGLPITLHLQPSKMNDHQDLDILEETGAKLEKVVVGHRDGVLAIKGMTFDKAMDHYYSVLERGCYVQFDLCGNQELFKADLGHWWLPSDRERAQAIKLMCDHGYEDRILISQDEGHKYYMTEFGGWGLAHVLTGFRETMLDYGVTEAQCDKITKDNPQKMLTIF
ncbi:MAG TPA: hypothetical protein IAC50_05975 [Candidatus Copromorpha excrementigallinarum]|uniref:Phosphotriesterase-related protein n=1 Tax=Candidatus Allocopromorpha excrementigallinarum TaxID=2840742 RepID=A0A9D1L5U2_9FIRM|nr:hypothetical protein [Candidatus Copromorpha excrementigallinarum]